MLGESSMVIRRRNNYRCEMFHTELCRKEAVPEWNQLFQRNSLGVPRFGMVSGSEIGVAIRCE